MTAMQGFCPGCGAPLTFGLGSSWVKVCAHCRTTVRRTDRGLSNLGKAADLAPVPSLIRVGDRGTLSGASFEVHGRIQLDWGNGPWEEYYVSFDGGRLWGWLAYDEGLWMVEVPRPLPGAVPLHQQISMMQEIDFGQAGTYRIVESRSGRVVSAEGELPEAAPEGETFYYADLHGPAGGFATLDYGDRSGPPELFMGRRFFESELKIHPAGPRDMPRATLDEIKCLNCGGSLPLLTGARAERVGCRYCNAVNDLSALKVVATQDDDLTKPEIAIGTRATYAGVNYVFIAYLRRSMEEEGERYGWDEYLLWAEHVGFRWLVKDEGQWMWSTKASPGELKFGRNEESVQFGGVWYTSAEDCAARVDYVLGELTWKCEVGETVHVTDYRYKGRQICRELSDGEVQWSYETRVPEHVVMAGLAS